MLKKHQNAELEDLKKRHEKLKEMFKREQTTGLEAMMKHDAKFEQLKEVHQNLIVNYKKLRESKKPAALQPVDFRSALQDVAKMICVYVKVNAVPTKAILPTPFKPDGRVVKKKYDAELEKLKLSGDGIPGQLIKVEKRLNKYRGILHKDKLAFSQAESHLADTVVFISCYKLLFETLTVQNTAFARLNARRTMNVLKK